MIEEKTIERCKELIKTEHANWIGISNQEAIRELLNMLEGKDKAIEKLKKHNKELLRKLKNRVKEVKKLNKYSLYKKEFKRLNEQLKKKDEIIEKLEKEAQGYFEENIKKDKIIDLIIDEYEYNARINLKDFCENELRKDTCIQDCKTCIKQYFEQKSDKRRLIAIF